MTIHVTAEPSSFILAGSSNGGENRASRFVCFCFLHPSSAVSVDLDVAAFCGANGTKTCRRILPDSVNHAHAQFHGPKIPKSALNPISMTFR
jgi:hypothetical protein